MKPDEMMVELIRSRGKMPARRGRIQRALRPTLIALEYSKALMPWLNLARDMVHAEVLSKAKREIATRDREREEHTDAASVAETLKKLAGKLISRVGPQRMGDVAEKFANRTSDFHKDQLRQQVKSAISVDISSLEPSVTKQIGTFVSDNVSLIKSVPQQYFNDIETAVADGVKSGMRWETLAKELDTRYNVAASRVELIARDQVGKLYGILNSTRQQALGIDRFTWRTVKDERVRDEHESLNGQSFEWSNPPDEGLPGDPILCRCYADPDFTSILESLGGKS